MIEQNRIDRVKQIPIVDFLASRGIHPVAKSGEAFVYNLRNEKTPSAFVSERLNAWKDFGHPDYKGDVISLVRVLDSLSFPAAIAELEKFLNEKPVSFFPKGKIVLPANEQQPEYKDTYTITKIQRLQNKALLDYLSKRKLNVEFGKLYFSECYFTYKDKRNRTGRDFFALCLKTEKGGFELFSPMRLRDKDFKTTVGPKSHVVYEIPTAEKCLVFESVFDYLALLTYQNVSRFGSTVFILNSGSTVSQVGERLKAFKEVFSFMHNDEAGQTFHEKICGFHSNVTDCRSHYQGHKDFNDWLAVQSTT